MKVKVIENYQGYEGERPIFPKFPKGEKVTLTGEMCNDFTHWYPCDIASYPTYIPESFIQDGRLARDYNPTELSQNIGDVLEVQEIVNAWLIATNSEGVTGWIPAEAVVSDVQTQKS